MLPEWNILLSHCRVLHDAVSFPVLIPQLCSMSSVICTTSDNDYGIRTGNEARYDVNFGNAYPSTRLCMVLWRIVRKTISAGPPLGSFCCYFKGWKARWGRGTRLRLSSAPSWGEWETRNAKDIWLDRSSVHLQIPSAEMLEKWMITSKVISCDCAHIP